MIEKIKEWLFNNIWKILIVSAIFYILIIILNLYYNSFLFTNTDNRIDFREKIFWFFTWWVLVWFIIQKWIEYEEEKKFNKEKRVLAILIKISAENINADIINKKISEVKYFFHNGLERANIQNNNVNIIRNSIYDSYKLIIYLDHLYKTIGRFLEKNTKFISWKNYEIYGVYQERYNELRSAIELELRIKFHDHQIDEWINKTIDIIKQTKWITELQKLNNELDDRRTIKYFINSFRKIIKSFFDNGHEWKDQKEIILDYYERIMSIYSTILDI